MGSTSPYVVVRLVPESPVDGATFATYLDGLSLQLMDAYLQPPTPRSDLVYASPLILFQWAGNPGWVSLVSAPTSEPTSYNGSDYGKTLAFPSADGIPVGSYVFSADQTTIPPGSLRVTNVTQASGSTPATVQLSGSLSSYVPAGTVVCFLGESPSGDPTSAPSFSFDLATNAPATTVDNDLVVLHFADTTGITVGMGVSGTGVPAGTTVAFVDTGSHTVTVSQTLASSPSSVTFTLSPPFSYFTKTPTSGTPAAKPSTLKFSSGDTSGIAAGMTLVPVTGLIAPGTTITSVTATQVKLSQPFLASLPSGQQVTFTFPLSNGIVQHVEQTPVSWTPFTGIEFAIIPAAVATAVIPLNPSPPLPDYLDVTVTATRGAQTLPLPDTYYNVKVSTSALPTQPYEYQAIAPTDTSLYVSLPPPPGAHPISLTIPGDGSAPAFDLLFPAIQTALTNDPVPGISSPADLITSPAACKRIAYDIIWSYQNTLPQPPDALESLYTNPPNPGGGGSTTDNSSNNGSNNYEQDRQKFEGELGSFYSTNNASAQRLTKFVASASAAVACEQASLNSDSALLEFPVDPSVAYPNAVESELLVQGVSNGGAGGLNFGVPAPFFYALGANLDESTTTVQRFQMATGDTIERLLQQFATAENQNVISDTEAFSDTSVTPSSITAFQAARRLAALGVSAASTTPPAALTAGSQLAALVQTWLNATAPAPVNPPLTYDNTDFNIWTQQIATADPTGYLDLDLNALTQGFVIPATSTTLASEIASWLPGTTNPVTANPTVATLKQVTAAQWTSFFTANPSWLPPFTQPVAPGASPSPAPTTAGYIALRIRGFIRAVHQFFTVFSAATSAQLPAAGTPETFDLPSFDPIGQAVSDLLGTFDFGTALTSGDLSTDVQTVFGTDAAAQAWLAQAMTAINDLWQVASVVPNPAVTAGYSLPAPVSFAFSVMEALYARGFTSAQDIVDHAEADFGQALTGTVAYDYASALYMQAQTLATASPTPGTASGPFQVVNPDRSLIDCVPAPCQSPSGPIAYLQEMLALSELSTCDAVAAGVPTGTTVDFAGPTLSAVLSQRRGPIGQLAASCPNLDVPLPLIDIVNECLEHMAAASPATSGTVYDTTDSELPGDDQARLLAVMPEYSTPATPVAADAAAEPAAFNNLKSDFSSCELPYSQALDVSRTYLGALGSSRYEEMRAFRKCITEFVLDPADEPAGFQDWLWRYPVRIDIAREYLGITPEEYSLLFQGTPVPPCAMGQDNPPTQDNPPGRNTPAFAEREGNVGLCEFLAETCLSYCEFYELWQSGFAAFSNGAGQKDGDRGDGAFPECEPCCPGDLWLEFEDGKQQQGLADVLVFVRLWRILRKSRCGGYSFAQLRDICDVLQLDSGGSLNPDFVRQLASLEMLRGEFGMELADPEAQVPPNAVDADQTHLLALWVGPAATAWPWAVQQLLDRVEHYARRHHGCDARSPEFVKLLLSNLDPISALAGFDPTSATDSWHALPTHTLRFAEVLAKVYASDFSVGELIYLVTASDHLDGDDPFPLQEDNDALDFPLGLPDEEREHALWRLRADLLAVEVCEEEDEEWPWRRIDAALQKEFGFTAADTLALAQHFFPGVLAASGQHPDPAAALFVTPLAATTASTWNDPPDGPFSYDASVPQLTTRMPLTDRAVIEALTHAPDLSPAEQQAVQDLYFAPRAMLAGFALLFADFATAQQRLVECRDERERFGYFRRQFLLCHRRRAVIAEHLCRHVASVTGHRVPDGTELAELIIASLAADENTAAAGWENDSGAMPSLTWGVPAGGALAALLGLTGTGLSATYAATGGTTVWRDVSGPLSGFGVERDRENCPVPTVLPSLATTISAQDLQFASVHNGFAMKDATGAWIGGAQGFTATWSGTLLVDREGSYEFWAGAPTPGDERPDTEAAEHAQWRVVLSRGQRTWVLLSHHWPGCEEHRGAALPLKAGAYRLCVEFTRPAPQFSNDDQVHPQHTGFQLKYSGPDTDGCRTEVPHSRLFVERKDTTLGDGIEGLSGDAAAYLGRRYVSSLRDIRRTYQRAFKALLFASRFRLSAHRELHGSSELGYLLSQPALFAGSGYYRADGGFTRHAAGFDFDFLPVTDTYHPPAADARTAPSPQRVQAMFDWWERLHDYTLARADVHRRCQRQLWQLFAEAQEKQPADPTSLLRHLGADARDWALELRYFQGQTAPVYEVTSADLSDDRWTLRAWHADRWLRAAERAFATTDITAARPDLWASDDPSALLPGETQTGNANLVAFVSDGCLGSGQPRRYDDLRRLDDGLRERGRAALVAYLCHDDRVGLPWQPGQFAATAGDLSDLLLLDVGAGLCERASRIDEAVSAAQSFIRRARLGLEPGWRVTGEFARLWDSRFATYRTWEKCKRRELYRENWIEWDERDRARRIEAFRFLESELRSSTLSMAAPGGLDWWADDDKALEREPKLLQRRVPSELHALTAPPESATREGLGTLGSPEYATTPTWLTPVPQPTGSTGSTPPPPPPAQNGPPGGTIQALARAAANGSAAQSLPLWMESAINLGTRFVRVAAAGVPSAALGFTPHGDTERSGCCAECGGDHPVLMDEYYFWLTRSQYYAYTDETDAQDGGDASFTGSYQFGFQDSYYDQYQQQSAEWDDENQVPSLLARWQPGPAVRLAWVRVHNGEFGQPRTSDGYVAIKDEPDLVFLGRAGDSLYFQVSGSEPLPAGYGADTSPPGFRYDLPPDEAVTLPEVLAPPKPPATSPYPGGLPAYPFFAYFDPGARLFPASWFATSMAVAEALRGDCAFERALRWYRRAFDVVQQDCAWVHCDDDSGKPCTCCDATVVTEQGARDRAVVLHYCETLLEWGDALMRHRRSPEAFQQARLLFGTAARILGKHPTTLQAKPPATLVSVTDFVPAYAPLNPRLMDLYDKVDDRLALIHSCQDTRPQACADSQEWCGRPSPYRFLSQVAKALELAAKLRELDSALLSAYEKCDAEYLASVHARQAREMLTLGVAINQDQWRDADWQVQALQQTKDVSQTNLIYFTNLYQAGLVNDEIQNLDLTTSALQIRTGANITEAAGEIMNIIPDSFFGAMSSGAVPPIGTKIAHFFQSVARIMTAVADIQTTTAAMDATEATWQRRSDEWFHQMQVLPIEIQQTELQILGAQRRRDQALAELNNTQRQIEHATEVLDFLRDKFTATDLYLWLRKETGALHARMYDLTLRAALEAQRAWNFERGHTTRRFIPEESWDSLHDGLMAGERLECALRTMEKAYLDENRREYELTKHISLRLQFPAAYLALRTTGHCHIDIPEWMFDLDYPGQYLRRIRDAKVTLAWVGGPFTGVHCRLTLLSSSTRIHPDLRPPAHHCRCEGKRGSEYEACADDPRIVHEYAARESIATSSGQNDSGLFELNFRDERYLPFEYQGAVSRWRIDLPPENNYFDLDTVSDVVLHLDYTAREGGEVLRAAAQEDARRHLPGDGLRLFDVRHDFPDAWPPAWRPGQGEWDANGRHEAGGGSLTRRDAGERDSHERDGDRRRRSLRLGLTPGMFPFVPGKPARTVDQVVLLFAAPDAEPGRHHTVRFWWDEDGCERATEFTAIADSAWPGYFVGAVDLHESPLGPLRDSRSAVCGFGFPAQAGEVRNAFVIAHYTATEG